MAYSYFGELGDARVSDEDQSKTRGANQKAASLPTTEIRYYTVSEAADLLRARRWTIAAAIRDKKLPYIRMGKKVVLMRTDLDAFALARGAARADAVRGIVALTDGAFDCSADF